MLATLMLEHVKAYRFNTDHPTAIGSRQGSFERNKFSDTQVPMLPGTHGVVCTRWHVLAYTILLFIVTLLPYLTGMSGEFYLGGAVVLGGGFLWYAIRLLNLPDDFFPMKVFNYAIIYLMALFAFLLVDHYVRQMPPLDGGFTLQKVG